MRLREFILQNIEPILAEWEAFARSVRPGPEMDPGELRDHAKDILQATAWDMKSAQTAAQQSDKSKGDGDAGADRARIDGASDVHAVGRVRSGFDMISVVAEYRALRATVIRLWRDRQPPWRRPAWYHPGHDPAPTAREPMTPAELKAKVLADREFFGPLADPILQVIDGIPHPDTLLTRGIRNLESASDADTAQRVKALGLTAELFAKIAAKVRSGNNPKR
jgi:hypothetical protein